jgi:Rrf2 family protein
MVLKMKITTKGQYGLRAIADLAIQQRNGENAVTLKSIAERQGISPHYLEQLMSALKKGGIVNSTRGSKGGYVLNRSVAEISAGQILTALEGQYYPADCLNEDDISKHKNTACSTEVCRRCVVKSVTTKLFENIDKFLNGITLEDILNEREL